MIWKRKRHHGEYARFARRLFFLGGRYARNVNQ